MILCEIKDAGRYAVLSGALKKAIEWLQNYQPDDFVKGVIDLGVPDGFSAEILVKCQELSLVPRENARLEAHHRFMDIELTTFFRHSGAAEGCRNHGLGSCRRAPSPPVALLRRKGRGILR